MDAAATILSKWCAANSVYIDHRLRIQVQNETQGIGVFSLSSIPQDAILVKIPKDAVLSVRTCFLAEHIKFIPYGVGAQLSLSLALYAEILRQDQSNWYGYLQSLPTTLVDLPVFWMKRGDPSDADDCEEALRWLTGTEAAKILQSKTDNQCILLDEITHFFFDIAEPLLLHHLPTWTVDNFIQYPTLSGFYRAFSLVSSRAFLVDSYHGLSMVAIADAFNHAVDNHVHLESDFYVCTECGSVKECTHDTGDLPSTFIKAARRRTVEEDYDHESFYEMVSNTVIPPNSEVFNTYGETLTNAQLLNQYGFILDVNENDRLSWTFRDVLRSCCSDSVLQDGVEVDIRQLAVFIMDASLRATDFFDQSELTYREVHGSEHLCLNDEGKVSAQLWTLLLAASLRLSGQFGDLANAEELIRNISGLELALESSMEVEEDDSRVEMTVCQGLRANAVACQILLQLARSVVNICDARTRGSGKPGSSGWNLSDLLEEIPESRGRTRLAISFLLSERSILDACKAGWLALIMRIQDVNNHLLSVPSQV